MRVLAAVCSLALVLLLSPVANASTLSLVSPVMLVRAGSSDVTYLLVKATCTKSGCFRLYRTNMEGSSFTLVGVPPSLESEMGSSDGITLENLSFANPKDGFASVGPYDATRLYATTDGGRSWHLENTPKDLVGVVHVTNAGLLAMTAVCGLKNGECGDYRVWRAALDAQKWTALPTLWKTGPHGSYYGPSFAAFGNTVWELETANNGADYVWTSRNDGRTFTRVTEKFPALASVSGCQLTPMSTASTLGVLCDRNGGVILAFG